MPRLLLLLYIIYHETSYQHLTELVDNSIIGMKAEVGLEVEGCQKKSTLGTHTSVLYKVHFFLGMTD